MEVSEIPKVKMAKKRKVLSGGELNPGLERFTSFAWNDKLAY